MPKLYTCTRVHIMTILNLTQHVATAEQLAAGVVDLSEDLRIKLQELLTFEDMPNSCTMQLRADSIARLASNFFKEVTVRLEDSPLDLAYRLDLTAPGLHNFNNLGMFRVMIGGAPFFMNTLETELKRYNLRPVYAFSQRTSEYYVSPETGHTHKTTVFKHLGFVKAI